MAQINTAEQIRQYPYPC